MQRALRMAAVLMALICIGCRSPKETPQDASPSEGQLSSVQKDIAEPIQLEEAALIRVVDGDTLIVRRKGARKDEKVRLLLVDCPESVSEDASRNGRFGDLAAEFTKKTLKGVRAVYLMRDVSDRDQYGRLLRYVFLKPLEKANESDWRGLCLNAILLKEGYANVVTFPPDVLKKDLFLALSKEARETGEGLYRMTDIPNLKEAQEIDNEQGRSQDFIRAAETKDGEPLAWPKAKGRIIGNQNSMRYHLPDGQGYRKVKAKNAVFFETEEDAKKAGYRPAVPQSSSAD